MWAIREGNVLRPWGVESATIFAKVPFGKPVFVELRQPRNGAHHRLYWTLCARIANAVGCEAEDISFILKRRTGYVKEVRTKRGIEEIPKSISFAAMDQTAFRDFFDKCVHVIYTEFGIVRSDVLDCVKELLERKDAA